jgi:hypothetical protein
MADELTSPNNSPGAPGQGKGNKTPRVAKKGFWKRLKDSLSKNNVHGDAHVSAGAIIITALFLIILTIGLLYSIVVRWPACELPEETVNSNMASNANGNTASSANGNASIATVANANAANINNNANANNPPTTNTNTGGNVGAGTPTPTPPPGATPITTENGATITPTTVVVKTVEPKSGPVTGRTLVIIKGANFGTSADGLKVKFDGLEAKISKISDESITARTPPHSEGAVDVSIEKGKERDVLSAEYTYTCPAPTGTNLFYMLIFAGALGGCIHSMRSLAWYVGQRELRWSWLPTYFTLPFVGAAMAMLFGLLIFAGLFDSNNGRSQSLFIIAVAGLVGMFSQQAALKLTDIANAIFTKPGAGKDAEPQKSISVDANAQNPSDTPDAKIDPNSGPVGGGQTVKLVNVSKVNSIDFGGEDIEITDDDFDEDTSTITLETPAHDEGEIEVKVKDAAGKTVILKYNYKADQIGSP